MTISSTTNRVEYVGNGVTTLFAFPYKFFANADLKVYQDGTLKTITTHYSVTGALADGGGSVSFVTAPASGEEVVIIRAPAITQETDLVENDPFPAESIENALDKLTVIAQRTDDRASRAIIIPDSDVDIDTELPPAADRADTLLGFNSTGNVMLYNTDPSISLAYTAKFVGDGATTVFTLPNAVGGVRASFNVYVNGVYQLKSSYTVSGTTLTFTDAPVSTSDPAVPENIEAIWLPTTNIASADASAISYTPNSTGAVTSDVETKLREQVSVKDFGAKGNGIDDDTTAFQAALDSGSVVYIPKPTSFYKLTSGLTKAGNLTLTGDGAAVTQIRWTSAVSAGITLTGGQYKISGISLRTSIAGGGTAISMDSGAFAPSVDMDDVIIWGADLAADYWTKGIVASNIRESTFSRLNIRGQTNKPASMTHGIQLTATSNATNVWFDKVLVHTADTAIDVTTSTNPGIEGVYVSNSTLVFVNNGITWDGRTSGYFPPGLQVTNTHINTYDKAIEGLSVSQALLSNNLIYKRLSPTSTTTANPIVSFKDGSGNVVSGNFINMLTGVNTSDGIYFYGTEQQGVISNNNISMQTSANAAIRLLDTASNTIVRGNLRTGGTTTVANGSSGTLNYILDNFPPQANIQSLDVNIGTPNVAGYSVNVFRTANTALTNITAFSGAYTGQIFTVTVLDVKTTFVHGATLQMIGGINYTPAIGVVLTFQCDSNGDCREVSRSA